MAEYIEREALLKRLNASPLITNYRIMRGSQLLIDGILDLVQKQPAADVVEVVRCKDCKHFTAGYCCRDIKGRSQMHYMGDNAFCSYGAKMDGEKV